MLRSFPAGSGTCWSAVLILVLEEHPPPRPPTIASVPAWALSFQTHCGGPWSGPRTVSCSSGHSIASLFPRCWKLGVSMWLVQDDTRWAEVTRVTSRAEASRASVHFAILLWPVSAMLETGLELLSACVPDQGWWTVDFFSWSWWQVAKVFIVLSLWAFGTLSSCYWGRAELSLMDLPLEGTYWKADVIPLPTQPSQGCGPCWHSDLLYFRGTVCSPGREDSGVRVTELWPAPTGTMAPALVWLTRLMRGKGKEKPSFSIYSVVTTWLGAFSIFFLTILANYEVLIIPFL